MSSPSGAIWTSAAAARIWGIIAELAASGLVVLADKGYTGAGDHVRVPYKGKNKPASQKDANRAHARLRGPGERANAQLKSWRILRKLRCCPWRAGQLAKAIHVLQAREIGGLKKFLVPSGMGHFTRAGPAKPGPPMLERFDENARTVFARARDEARALGRECIDTEHVLLGVCHQGWGQSKDHGL